MVRKLFVIAVATLLGATGLLADFSYEQTSKMTGGMMAGMMKVVGVFSKQAREPIRSTVLMKGDRMATFTQQNAHIIDLAKETITEIDFQKKQYSVVTFAQMADALKQLEAKMKTEKGEQSDISFKTDVKNTGQTKQIGSYNAQQVIVTVEMEGSDKDSGKRGTFMVVTSDMWIAPNVPGYDEVRSFQQRMAQKLNWMPSAAGMFSQGRSDVTKGMAEASKEMAKLQGVPVVTYTKMGFKVEGQQQAAGGQAAPPPPPQQQAEPEKPSAGGALGRLGGRLGGLRGIGRRREEPPQQQQQQQGQQPGGDPSGTLLEMTTETTSFSSAAVDTSKFEVPAGFKQVENEMVKASRK